MASPGLYDTFRVNGGPTLYPSIKTPVTVDVLEVGFLYAIAILSFSLFIALPGVRGTKEKGFVFTRIFIGVFVLASIFLSNFGQEWEVSFIHTRTQYRAGITKEIDANIGVKIGLRSVNITLKTNPVVQTLDNSKLVNETINYNERFSWNNLGWTQQRIGFGPLSSTVNREFRAAQVKGLPYPILWIAEYFTIDGEGIRWGRYYRQAGYYSHIMLWTAFPFWILTLVLYQMVLRYGAYFSMMTGGCMLMANILFATIRNPTQLAIPFRDQHVTFHWGWSFWLSLVSGILCVLIGIITYILDITHPELIATFFGHDVASEIEEYYLDTPSVEVIDGSKLEEQSASPNEKSSTIQNRTFYQAASATIAERRFRKRGGPSVVPEKLYGRQHSSKNRDLSSRRRPRTATNEVGNGYRAHKNKMAFTNPVAPQSADSGLESASNSHAPSTPEPRPKSRDVAMNEHDSVYYNEGSAITMNQLHDHEHEHEEEGDSVYDDQVYGSRQ